MRLTKEQIVEVCKKYKQGISCPKIAREFNVSAVAIQGLLKRRNISLRSQCEAQRKLFFNENAFNVITEESAYWIGFLMADGNVSYKHGNSPEISLVLQARDKEHLIKFRSFLKAEHALINIHKCNSVRFSIKSKTLTADLKMYNVVPRKSFTARATGELILNRHFWRGVIDGDGSIGVYKSGIMLRLYGSFELLNQFLVFIKPYTPDCKVTVRKHKNIYIVNLCGKYAKDMINVLYSNCTIALSRKLNAAKNISFMAEVKQPIVAKSSERFADVA